MSRHNVNEKPDRANRLISIVLATNNQGKIKEIKAILGGGFTFYKIRDYRRTPMREPGGSLQENSLAKAAFAYRLSGKPCLADDSGLFIDALHDEPGVRSARYGRTDHARIAKVLRKLESEKNRSAKFKAVFVYYYAPNKYKLFEGECRGSIAHAPRGKSGFGYDPIFIPKGFAKTFAQIGAKTKNRISHRAKALIRFKKFVKQEP